MKLMLSDGVDLAEIEAIYRQQLGPLRRVAHAIVGDEDTARDVVQEAFASAIRSHRRFRGDGTALSWVWQMVVNAAISEQRRRVRKPTVELVGEETAAVSDGGAGGFTARLAVALPLLPQRQRLAVFLHYYADLDYRTIGDVLAISPGTVGATLHAARQTLLQALTAQEFQ